MKIAVINASNRVGNADAEKMTEAVALQTASHAAPLWDRLPPSVTFYAAAAQAPTDADQIVIFDNADQADALGYHSEGPDGKPYGKVFVSPVLDNGGGVLDGGSMKAGVSSVLSHEALELWGDPAINVWVDGPALAEGTCYALELCDPCEQNSYVVKIIDGTDVLVSDFVTPQYFDEQAPAGSVYDWCRAIDKPFVLAAGGYVIVRAAPGSEKQVFGEKQVPAWKMKAKAHAASRTSRRCRSKR